MMNLEELASEKEREVNELRLQHTQNLSKSIKRLEEQLLAERKEASQLKADFDYNLSLLSARDQELSNYETAFTELKGVLNGLVAENSELKARLDGACKELEGSKDVQLQLKTHYQSKLKEIHSQMDGYRRSKQSELDCERDKLEKLQRTLERRLLELEGETQCYQDQLMADFDQTLKRQDHEYQLRVDQLSSALLSQESCNQRLEKELERARRATQRVQEELRESARECEEKLREHKEKAWKMESEIQVLEEKKRHADEIADKYLTEMKRTQENFLKKHVELDKKAREKEANLKAAKEAHHCQEQLLKQQSLELQALLEQKEEAWRQREAGLQQAVRDKEELLQRSQADISAVELSRERKVEVLNRELVERDLTMQSYKDTVQCLKVDLQDKEGQLAQLSEQLSHSLDKIRTLEQGHAQKDLEMEDKVREAQRIAYSSQQKVIQKLTAANTKLLAECEEVRSMLKAQTSTTADQVTDESATLQAQNAELRSVIAQMREELEHLSESAGKNTEEQNVPSTDYVQYMESEVRRMKSENRSLIERLQQMSVPQGRPPTPNTAKKRNQQVNNSSNPVTPPARHRDHLIALSDTIATLQREKGEVERLCEQWKDRAEQLQEKVKEEQEMIYVLKACCVPQSKLHQKLVQATHVITSLVKEKELLSSHVNNLLSKNGCKAQGLDKAIQTDYVNEGPANTPSPRHQEQVFTGPTSPRSSCPALEQQEQVFEVADATRSHCSEGSGLTQHRVKERGTRPVKEQAGFDQDMSLMSLQFTESSSLDSMSLDQMVAQLDGNLEAFSSDPSIARHSPSEKEEITRGSEHAHITESESKLELVGREVKAHIRSSRQISQQTSRVQLTHGVDISKTQPSRNDRTDLKTKSNRTRPPDIHGEVVLAHSQTGLRSKQISSNRTAAKAHRRPNPVKVRNYNIKDDVVCN